MWQPKKLCEMRKHTCINKMLSQPRKLKTKFRSFVPAIA